MRWKNFALVPASIKMPAVLGADFTPNFIDGLKAPATIRPPGPEVLRISQKVLKERSDGLEPDEAEHFFIRGLSC